jgi:hypothetical protein
MQNRLIASALGCGLVLLSACASPQPKVIEISAKPIEKPELILPSADALNLRDVQWIVITPDNVDEVMTKLSASGGKVAVFALTDKGYENLSMNINDLRTYISQLQAIIVAYEGYYKDSNSALDAANAEIQAAGDEAKTAITDNSNKGFLGLY